MSQKLTNKQSSKNQVQLLDAFVITMVILSQIQCVSRFQSNSRSLPTDPEAIEIFETLEQIKEQNQVETSLSLTESLVIRPDDIPDTETNKSDGSVDVWSSDEAKNWFTSLAKQYAPIIYLNNGKLAKIYNEPYHLSKVENFIHSAGVKYYDPLGKKTTICIEPGQIKQDYSNLFNFSCAGKTFTERNFDSNLHMFISPTHFNKVVKGGDGKCYTTAKFIDPSRSPKSNIENPAFHKTGYAEISYIFWYPYNGNPVSNNILLRKIFERVKAGHHEGDWEHMTIRIKFNPSKFNVDSFASNEVSIVGIHYAAHANDESIWYKKESMPSGDLFAKEGFKILNNRVLGFIGSQTHATYNRIHKIARFTSKKGAPKSLQALGWLHILPSEKTNQGLEIDCREHLEFLPIEESQWIGKYAWLNFPGRMGTDPGGKASGSGPSNVSFKTWYFMQEGF